jgi:glucose/arabinose dehydrogenase
MLVNSPVFESNEHRLELMAEGLSFPTGLTFDTEGTAYIAEAGLPFGGAQPGGRIWQIKPDESRRLLASGLRPPVNGVTFHNGYLYVSEGGHPAGITRLSLNGEQTAIVSNMPGPGNYHINMVAFGPDGKLYFSQGAMTNTGIVGLDAYEMGWLKRLPHAHDLPGYDISLTGVNVETSNPLSNNDTRVRTGGFAPFGTSTESGQRIASSLPCTAGVMRCNPDGSSLELVAWGLRNAYGLGFLPDGTLLATDQGADDRGSRPIGDAPDLLFEVRQGAWYGWPDFIGGDPIMDRAYWPTRGPVPSFLLANHAELPPPERPLLRFPAHTCAVKLDAVPEGAPRFGGKVLVALFGDERPITAPSGPSAGREIACIDPADWSLRILSIAKLSRPIDVRFNPSERSIWLLDFGEFEVSPEHGMVAHAGSGRIWRLI